jgi:O-acetylserine/cysteine efflux transporter
MRPRDFALVVLICLVWAFNNVISKIVVGHWHVPPIYFAAVRFAIVALATLPWLLPIPKQMGRITAIALLMGAANFALLFLGLQTTSPSVAAIVVQAGMPFTVLLSVLMLGERIHWRRGSGIALTLVGIVMVVWKPGDFHPGWGIAYILASAMGASLGSVLIKQVEGISPLRFQAWVGFLSVIPLTIGSALFEQGQWTTSVAAGWPFIAGLLYAALVVSVFAHSVYYWLIGRYEANLLAPLTLMNPLMTFGLGALFTGDRFDLRMALGAAIALLGVLIVAARPKRTAELLVEREQP